MRVHLKGVHTVSKTLAGGQVVTYRYAWRGGPRLMETPGTTAFVAEYSERIAERKRPAGDTFFSLIAEYKQASEFTTKRERTRKDYLRYLGMIEREFGSVPIAALSDARMRGDFKEWRDRMADTPRAADLAWTVLARVLSVAKDRGKIDVNVCERGGRLYTADRNDRLWTPEMVAVVREEFPAHLRWAFILALHTGQRQGDILALPWSGYKGGRIRLRQSKGGRRVSIPVTEELRAEIAGIPKRATIMLTSSDRRPWTSDGFRASWSRACKAAGIEGVTFHDIRGSAVTKLAEAGCSTAEIATITGHSPRDVDAILDAHYLSRTDALADNAIRKLERKEKRTKTVNRHCKPLD